MNVKFKLKDVNVKLPAVDTKLSIGELVYEVENANVLELAGAMKTILKSVTEFKADFDETEREDTRFYKELNKKEDEPEFDLPFSSIDSSNEGRDGSLYDIGDYVRESESFAGTIVDKEEEGVVTIFIQEAPNKDDIGKKTKAYVDNIMFSIEGNLTMLLKNGQDDFAEIEEGEENPLRDPATPLSPITERLSFVTVGKGDNE